MKSITATGTIIGASPSDSNANGSLDTPTFTFTAEDGKPYTVTSVVSTSPPEFAVGQEVKVFYEKSHPEGARLDSFWQLWFFSFLFGILGTFFTTVGYFLMQYQRRRVRQRLMNSTSGGVLSGTEL